MESTQPFNELLCALASGHCTSELWELGAVAHYTSVEAEAARVKLVRASIKAGVWQWPSVPLLLVNEAVSIQAALIKQGA